MTSPSSRRYVLILGEGDFSFSLHLLQSQAPGSETVVTATSFDTRDEIQQKFGDDGIRIVEKVESLGGVVLHRIDATEMESYPEITHHTYDEIIFHHPHCGVEDAKRHRILLAHIFRSAANLLLVPDGTVTISLAGGQAERWAIVDQATLSCLVLLKAESLTSSFNWRRHQGRSFQLIHRGNNSVLQSSISFTFGHQSRSSEAIQWNSDTSPSSTEPLSSFSCELCHKIYRTAQGLRTHTRSAHSNPTPPSASRKVCCDQCQREFVDDSALKLHELAKHGPDPVIKPDWYRLDQDDDRQPAFVSCIICRQSFPDMGLYRKHLEELRPSAPLALPCNNCIKVFTSQHSLRQHSLHCQIRAISRKEGQRDTSPAFRPRGNPFSLTFELFESFRMWNFKDVQ